MCKEEALEKILYETRIIQAAKKEPKPKGKREHELIDYYKNERKPGSYRR